MPINVPSRGRARGFNELYGKINSHESRSEAPFVVEAEAASTADASRKASNETSLPQKNTKGSSGTEVPTVTNCIILNKITDFALNCYAVDFDPPEDNEQKRKTIIKNHMASFGNFTFDGQYLYTAAKLPTELGHLESLNEATGKVYRMLVRWLSHVLPEDPAYIRFHNTALRAVMEKMGLEQIGKNFYDRSCAIAIPDESILLWKGYMTRVHSSEAGLLLRVEVTHKVLRGETALDCITSIVQQGLTRSRPNFQQKDVEKALIGTVVLTSYNRRTYRIEGIDFSRTPASTFVLQNGESTSYIDYYKERWDIDLSSEPDQPLLISKPCHRDVQNGVTELYLIPSLCQLTGISDAMRRNFPLMKKLAVHLYMEPMERKKVLDDFRQNLTTPQIQGEFAKWGLEPSSKFLRCDARVLKIEKVEMREMKQDGTGTKNWFIPDSNNDWSIHFRRAGLLQPFAVERWVLLYPSFERNHSVRAFIGMLQRVGKKMGAKFKDPLAIISYDFKKGFCLEEFMGNLHQFGEDLELVFYVLPTGVSPMYPQVKRACTLQLKTVSQCMQAKNLTTKSMAAVCQKLVLQICAKLRGEPWRVNIPISNAMILGFDAYRCTSRIGEFAGALVSSLNKNCTRYFSSVSFHSDKEGMSVGLSKGLANSLSAYMSHNDGDLPGKILVFRDCVREDEIEFVVENEVKRLEMTIKEFYHAHGKDQDVKLAVVVVMKRGNTRFMLEDGEKWDNPKPGTVLDSAIMVPERFEFFLVSQTVRQGTVGPTGYHVVHNTTSYTPDQFQTLAFKLCHLYFNRPGAAAVPAACVYARKLAYITGTALMEEAPPSLADTLWYL